ncbi:MAG: adenylosuccinate synthase [Candidatus Aenigmarchaeota archaeon]|nr:adenylosuccinate synthase [Candidatus Aenigmarchaeota archaeon]
MLDIWNGAQWGDEGKGKIVVPAMRRFGYKANARYQGGNNAGHTIYLDGQKIVFKQVPSGIVVPDTYAIMGNGMVVNLKALYMDELKRLDELGIEYSKRLFISDKAHVIFPHHIEYEASSATSKKVDTTKKGIGPAYTDKTARKGIRIGDLMDAASDSAKRKDAAEMLRNNGATNPEEALCEQLRHLERIAPYVRNTTFLLNGLIEQRLDILGEGAQGTLLDIDHGTYPFVTSSSTTAGGAATGLGIGPRRIRKVISVAKAYTTRVGEGPFPTELNDPTGDRLRTRGDEFGSVTGRLRRCGWFDVPLVRYACDMNSTDKLVLTKLDVLDEEDTIKVCVRYDGIREGEIPFDLANARPVYKEIRGWKRPTKGIQRFEELPSKAQDYVDFLKDAVGRDFLAVSTGPRERDLIWI